MSGVASISLKGLHTGPRKLSARYSGDGSTVGNWSPVATQTVTALPSNVFAAGSQPAAGVSRDVGGQSDLLFGCKWDGRADAIYFDTYRSNGVWIALSNGRAGFSAVTKWAQLPGSSSPTQLQFADVNSDGRVDLLYFDTARTNQVVVGLSNGVNGFATPASWLQHGASLPSQMQYADVNADGRADALYSEQCRLGVSLDGVGFTTPTKWHQLGTSTVGQVQYADIDGDQMADLLYFDSSFASITP